MRCSALARARITPESARFEQSGIRFPTPARAPQKAVAGQPGRPKQKPKKLIADKAFDCEPLRHILRWLGIEPVLPARGADEHGLGVWRWFVERTISWLHKFRGLRIRWDRKPEVHQGFLTLAAAVICYRVWINES